MCYKKSRKMKGVYLKAFERTPKKLKVVKFRPLSM
jgi:hypothetical protein